VPETSLPFWTERFAALGVDGLKSDEVFGEKRLHFAGPDGDGFALVEAKKNLRVPWTRGGIGEDNAIRGFHSASLRLSDEGPSAELLRVVGFEEVDTADGVKRFGVPRGNGADFIDIETTPNIARARQGAGSVHHTAGRCDPICPPSQTNALGDFFRRQGSTVALEWHDGGHELRPSELASLARLLGASRASSSATA
jgi:glyoxalase family protein